MASGITFSAQAQISNRPFGFQSGPASNVSAIGSNGMSPAYRELILERKILGRSATNGTFIKGSDGSLINVTRSGSQAFSSPVAAPFVAAGYGGFGVSASIGGIGFGYLGDGNGTYGPGWARGAPAGAVPIDGWIAQLNYLDQPAS
jgi:hypothetical protein